ncbi:MAG: transcription-repair coupling factor [Magnetococcales bacterium]|nr:transcription-repair coupling factor [Magnetococcales bacterium]
MSHPLLNSILPLLEASPPHAIPSIGPLPDGSLSWLTAELAQTSPAPLVLVTRKTSRAEALYRELLFFSQQKGPSLSLLPFPAWETLPFDRFSPFSPLVGERITTLFRLTQMVGLGPVLAENEAGDSQGVIITTTRAIMQRLMPRSVLTEHGFSIAKGDQLNLSAFRTFLTTAGYYTASQVVEPGEFSVRGGILDFFPPGHEDPVRVELFGDEVETLRLFDPISQRSTDRIQRVQALPIGEVLLNEETISRFRTEFRQAFGGNSFQSDLYKGISKGEKVQGMEHFLPLFYDKAETLFDYLPSGSRFLLDTQVFQDMELFHQEILQRDQRLSQEKNDPTLPDNLHYHLKPESLYLLPAEVRTYLANFPVLQTEPDRVDQSPSTGFSATPDFVLEAQRDEAPKKKSAFDRAILFLKNAQAEGLKLCVAVRTIGQREHLRETLEDQKITVADALNWPMALAAPAGPIRLVIGDVDQGFIHNRFGLVLLTEASIFGTRVRRRQVDQRYLDQLLASFADLREGDLVVHNDHGIGCFGGLHSLDVGQIRNDFLLITYAGSDKLYVPVENLDRVSKYSGADESSLDKLGSHKWKATKKKAKKKILEMAAELVALQAQRESRKGFAFSGADPVYQEFAAIFPFEETPDQAHAITTTLEDMASSRPMDRLVCGDVGFGKTEVALRAAFRALMDGKQVAVLTPTTILAQQHYETFSNRLAAYPINVELLSRFRSPGLQKKTVKQLAVGGVDLIVGTHRLLQKDIAFKDLGLLIVDEEQRFGVTHKERIKQLRATVDILTLTATPIPRTMHMAMAGVRDISIISTPPVDRLAIRTVICQYEQNLVREAILREIHRGGQVYYLYNRVQDIEKMAAQLNELVPEAKIGVAHGQMKESRLEKVMLSFYRQDFNLLLCSTIIENGVDIPTANTIIIHRADKFGLAQLHQLRGRVGRSKHRAYAYLLTPHPKSISSDARKRLDAIENLSGLGAGFMLATHDLEIRGAGNLLGDEQSGQVREVGYELYNQMLKEAIKKLKSGGGQPQPDEVEEEIVPAISLHLSTHIPSEYVPDVHLRLTLYKRIAELANSDEIAEMRVELIDRFGPLPDSVDYLLRVMVLKRRCQKLKILKLEAGPKGAALSFHPDPAINTDALIEMIQKGGGWITFNQASRTLSFRERNWADPADRLADLGDVLKTLSQKKKKG